MAQYGWFSQKALDAGHGSFIWTLRGSAATIEVTDVYNDPSGAHYKWSDKVFCGELGEFVRVGQPQTNTLQGGAW